MSKNKRYMPSLATVLIRANFIGWIILIILSQIESTSRFSKPWHNYFIVALVLSVLNIIPIISVINSLLKKTINTKTGKIQLLVLCTPIVILIYIYTTIMINEK